MRKLMVIVAMLSMLMVAPKVASAFTLIELMQVVALMESTALPQMVTDIAQNSTDIAQNSTATGQNSSDIADMGGDIAQNSTGIGQNSSDIGQNSTDIADMGGDIGQIGAEIGQMGSDIDQLGEQNESILDEMMSLTQCDQPIQLEDFDSPVLHEKVEIKSVYVDLTNSSKVQLHLKLDKDDPFGTERDVYVHKCMQEALGVALSIARDLKKGKTQTHAVVGLDSSGDAVLIRITIGKKLGDDDDDDDS